MKPPVIFLSFANDQDEHLPMLDEERKTITGHLIALANEQYIQLFSEPASTIKDLSNYVANFKDRIAIFHYGGHSASTKILLVDQAASSDGLAHLLALQKKNLKLVFLNGCSNKKQVELLFELGIPVVIATSVPLNDSSAREFADVFYDALVKDHTIEESFKLAAANYFMSKGEAVGIYRDLAGTGPAAEDEKDELPWGLYVNEGAEEVLSWKIPRQSAASFIVRGAGKKYQAGQTMNKQIVMTIANAIGPFSIPIRNIIEDAKRRDREPKMRDLRAAVIDSFPTPIGTHLRKLLLSEDISTDRLKKLINLYNIMTQFLSFLVMSQIWDEKLLNEALALTDDQQAVLSNFLNVSDEDLPTYNYMQLSLSGIDFLKSNDIKPFVEELFGIKQAGEENPDFQKGYRFLEEMKRELQGTIAADEIESFCVQSEENLCVLLEHFAFLAGYTLATIKTIELVKARNQQKPSYLHHLVILDRVTASFGVLDDVITSDGFSDNNSVVLLKDDEDVTPYINLSPFILDQNALLGQQNSKLFFFNQKKEGKFQFVFSENFSDPLVVDDSQYPELKEQFEQFIRGLLGSL